MGEKPNRRYDVEALRKHLPRVFRDYISLTAERISSRMHLEQSGVEAVLYRTAMPFCLHDDLGLPIFKEADLLRMAYDIAFYPDVEKALRLSSLFPAAFPATRVLGWFETMELRDLQARLPWLTDILDLRLPCYSKDELAWALEKYEAHLAGQRERLVRTGLPSSRFRPSPWLDTLLTNHLITKLPLEVQEGRAGHLAYSWADQNSDLWSLEALHDIRYSGNSDEIARQRYMLTNSFKGVAVPSYERAYAVHWLDDERAEHAESLREPLFEVKTKIVGVLKQAAETDCHLGLLEDCGRAITSILTRDDRDWLAAFDKQDVEVIGIDGWVRGLSLGPVLGGWSCLMTAIYTVLDELKTSRAFWRHTALSTLVRRGLGQDGILVEPRDALLNDTAAWAAVYEAIAWQGGRRDTVLDEFRKWYAYLGGERSVDKRAKARTLESLHLLIEGLIAPVEAPNDSPAAVAPVKNSLVRHSGGWAVMYKGKTYLFPFPKKKARKRGEDGLEYYAIMMTRSTPDRPIPWHALSPTLWVTRRPNEISLAPTDGIDKEPVYEKDNDLENLVHNRWKKINSLRDKAKDLEDKGRMTEAQEARDESEILWATIKDYVRIFKKGKAVYRPRRTAGLQKRLHAITQCLFMTRMAMHEQSAELALYFEQHFKPKSGHFYFTGDLSEWHVELSAPSDR